MTRLHKGFKLRLCFKSPFGFPPGPSLPIAAAATFITSSTNVASRPDSRKCFAPLFQNKMDMHQKLLEEQPFTEPT